MAAATGNRNRQETQNIPMPSAPPEAPKALASIQELRSEFKAGSAEWILGCLESKLSMDEARERWKAYEEEAAKPRKFVTVTLRLPIEPYNPDMGSPINVSMNGLGLEQGRFLQQLLGGCHRDGVRRLNSFAIKDAVGAVRFLLDECALAVRPDGTEVPLAIRYISRDI